MAERYGSGRQPPKIASWGHASLGPSPLDEHYWFQPVDDYVIFYRGVLQGNEVVVSEVRVIPRAGHAANAATNASGDPGDWPRRPDLIPIGGVTSNVLRAIDVEHVRLQLFLALREWKFMAEELHDVSSAPIHASIDEIALPTRKRPRPTIDLAHALLAHRYAEIADHTSRGIVKALASEFGTSRERIRDMLVDARRKSMLTATEPRRAGGRATSKTQRLLKRATAEELALARRAITDSGRRLKKAKSVATKRRRS